jgi:hypothetical protein
VDLRHNFVVTFQYQPCSNVSSAGQGLAEGWAIPITRQFRFSGDDHADGDNSLMGSIRTVSIITA